MALGKRSLDSALNLILWWNSSRMRLGCNHKQERAQPWPGCSSHSAVCLRKWVAETALAPAARLYQPGQIQGGEGGWATASEPHTLSTFPGKSGQLI